MKNISEKNKSAETVAPPQNIAQQLCKFAACLIGSVALCLAVYSYTVETLIPRSEVPATYKWFLLKEIPGPRIIFESGSNSHHGIDTEAVGEAMGMTAINIADNAGYPLEDKITRLETFTRPGDIVVLPLEWSHYHREKMTDNYVETLFTENRDYFRTMPTIKRIKRALSLPPEKVISEIFQNISRPPRLTESPAMELHNAVLNYPTGNSSRETPLGPGVGVAEQTCDEYILGKTPVRETLAMGKNIKPALKRLKKLKSRGVNIHFSWPILVGEGCMMADTYVKGFRVDIEKAVNQAGFEFLAAPSQSLYGQEFQDDTPYHLIQKGAAIHTQKIISLLKAQGYGRIATPFDITAFARHRLLELELADVKPIEQAVFPKGERVVTEEVSSRQFVEFSAGWWAFESYGRWMRDNRAMFRMTMPEDIAPYSVLKIQGRTLSGRLETVNVSVDGTLIYSGMFGEGSPLLVPLTELPQGEMLSMFLTLPETGTPQSPRDRGENQDARSMTLHLQSLELTTNEAEVEMKKEVNIATTKPVSYFSDNLELDYTQALSIDTPFSCLPVEMKTRSVQVNILFSEGWWAQETYGRWMKDKQATLEMKVADNAEIIPERRYNLRLEGKFFMNRNQSISAVINGKKAKPFTLTDDGALITPFEVSQIGDSVKVELELSGRATQSPKNLGLSEDDRTLTYFLKSAQLIPA